MNIIRKLIKDENGQALSEYGLVLGIVAVAVIAALVTLKDKILSLFTDISNSIDSKGTTTTGN